MAADLVNASRRAARSEARAQRFEPGAKRGLIVAAGAHDELLRRRKRFEIAVGVGPDEAARHDAFVTVHARSTEGVRMAVRNGVRIVHHATYLDDAAVTELAAARDDVAVCPGLHYLRQMVEGNAEPYGFTPERIGAALYPEELQAALDGYRELQGSGVRIVAGGDFGHQWTRHGTYAAELQRYVELVGMTPVEAILTATRNVGLLTGADTGEVRTGFLADLLVVDGDPTTDVAVLQDHDARRLVVKGGAFAYVNPARYP